MVNTERNWRRLGFMALLADADDGLSGSGLLTLWIVGGGGIVRGGSMLGGSTS